MLNDKCWKLKNGWVCTFDYIQWIILYDLKTVKMIKMLNICSFPNGDPHSFNGCQPVRYKIKRIQWQLTRFLFSLLCYIANDTTAITIIHIKYIFTCFIRMWSRISFYNTFHPTKIDLQHFLHPKHINQTVLSEYMYVNVQHILLTI